MMTIWFAIAGLFMLSLFGWVLAGYLYQQQRKLRREFNSVEKTLRAELTSLSSGTIGVGQRIIAVEKKLANLQASQENQKQLSTENRPYTEAAALVEKGADANQLIERCGLSEAEAQLITMMQQAQASQNSH